MPLENRNLEAGTRLEANYKKVRYVCTVEAAEEGEGIAFVLADGKRFKSPSAAASAVMGGGAVNGWRFWSLEGAEAKDAPETEAATESKPAKAKSTKKGKGKQTIYRIPNGPKTPEGKSHWFCVACMDSFDVEGEEPPAACPKNHPMEDLSAKAVAI